MLTKDQQTILALTGYIKTQEGVLADLRLFNDELEKGQEEASEISNIHQFLKK